MFAKVFKGLFYGSMTGQADPQLVFICLLTHCDRDGNVELPVAVIGTLTGLPQDRVLAAIAALEGPDPNSRTEAHEGRRLEPTGAGRWHIVNYLRYRAIRDENDRREQNKQAKARERERKRQQPSAGVSQKSAGVSEASSMSAQAEVEAEGRNGVGVSAAALARCKARFPNLDLLVIEAKLLAYHAQHPYRNLDRALVGWCLKAERNGWDRAASAGEDPESVWTKARKAQAVDGGRDVIPEHEVALTVLGRMVNFEPLARQGLAVLGPGDFAAPAHRHLFEAVRQALAEGRPFIPPEVGRHLLPHELPALAHAMELGIDAGQAAGQNFAAYARALTEQRVAREAKEIGARLLENPDREAVAWALAELRALQGRRDAPEPESFASIAIRTANAADPPAVETGIPTLDRIVRLEPCTLTVVGARSGVGKTALLVGMGLDASAFGWDVLVVSIEMSAEELTRRHCRGLKPGAAERLHLLRLDAPRVGEVVQAARRFAAAHAHPVVLLDYLQLVRPDSRYNARWEAVGEVVRELKALAMSAEVPVLVAAQLSRATEQRAGKRPELADLRESGETEQAADVVLLLHRNENEAELVVAKNRHGALGIVPLTFVASQVRFAPRSGVQR